MHGSKENLNGVRFHKMTVLERSDRFSMKNSKNVRIHAMCRCDCGKEKEVLIFNLKSGMTKSCGCLSSQRSKTKYEIAPGFKSGRLTVSSDPKHINGKWMVTCKCECGSEIMTTCRTIYRNVRKSCGCLNSERMSNIGKTMSLKHGMSKTPTYSIWAGMRSRCRPDSQCRKDYYDRGIRVCSEWDRPDGFVSFLEHVGERPTGLSLDRINNDGNYEPGNVRWATAETQNKNRRKVSVIDDFSNDELLSELQRRGLACP